MMEREQVDRKAQPQALRALRDCGKQQHRRGKQGEAVHEMHLGEPQGVEAQPVGLAGFLDQFGVALLGVLARDCRQLVEEVELHDLPVTPLQCTRTPSPIFLLAPSPIFLWERVGERVSAKMVG